MSILFLEVVVAFPTLVFLEKKAAFCVIFCTLSLLVLEIVASTSNNDNLRVYDSFRGAMEELFTVCESTDSRLSSYQIFLG